MLGRSSLLEESVQCPAVREALGGVSVLSTQDALPLQTQRKGAPLTSAPT